MDSGEMGVCLLGGFRPPVSHASTSGAGRCKMRSMACIPYLFLWYRSLSPASSVAVPIPGRSSTRASSSLFELDMSLVTVYKMGPLPFFNFLVLSPSPLATQYQPKDWYINIFGPWFGGLFGYNSSAIHNKVSGFWCQFSGYSLNCSSFDLLYFQLHSTDCPMYSSKVTFGKSYML